MKHRCIRTRVAAPAPRAPVPLRDHRGGWRLAAGVLAAWALIASLAVPAAEAQETTPAMVAAAVEEGRVVWYTSLEGKVAEMVAKAFRAEYPDIRIDIERAGSERLFERINQERRSAAGTKANVVDSSDATHFLLWKQQQRLAVHVPPDVRRFSAQYKDPDGYYAVWRATLSVIGYNTDLTDVEEAPERYRDLLASKWKGKLVKSDPAYGGTAMTALHAATREFGWGFLEKLARQDVRQVPSTTDMLRIIAGGERVVMIDGSEYAMLLEMKAKIPVQLVYPGDGTPLVTSPAAIFADAPHPNAARVLQNFLYTARIQQLVVDEGGMRSVHPDVKEPPGRTPLSLIKLLPDDAAGRLSQMADMRKRYNTLFAN